MTTFETFREMAADDPRAAVDWIRRAAPVAAPAMIARLETEARAG